jgi:hypothetical protein
VRPALFRGDLHGGALHDADEVAAFVGHRHAEKRVLLEELSELLERRVGRHVQRIGAHRLDDRLLALRK